MSDEQKPLPTTSETKPDWIPDGIELIPGWMSDRFAKDGWGFAILLDGGIMLAIETVDKIYQDAAGDLWMDVTLTHKDMSPCDKVFGKKLHLCPCFDEGRDKASIKVSKIIAGFEILDS